MPCADQRAIPGLVKCSGSILLICYSQKDTMKRNRVYVTATLGRKYDRAAIPVLLVFRAWDVGYATNVNGSRTSN